MAPRGSVGRGPSDWETDMHLSYPIKVGDRSRLTVMADVFNLFNRQAIDQYDERYNLPSDGDACAGIPSDICGARRRHREHPEHASTRPASIPNPRATATNPDYLRRASRSRSRAASVSASAGRSRLDLVRTTHGGPVRGAPFLFLYCPDATRLADAR